MSLFFFWFIIIWLLVSLSAVVPTGTRDFAAVIPLVVFSAYGLLEIIAFFKHKSLLMRRIVLILIVIGLGYGFLYFQTAYYFRFPIAYAKWWRVDDRDLSLYLKSQEPQYEQIILDKNIDFIYTSLVFYQAYPPAQFQREVVYEPAQLFTNVEKIGKYQFRKIHWDQDLNLKNTLFVTEPDNLPPGKSADKVFYYPTRPVVLSVENKIAQYPYTEPAFAIVTK